MQVPGEIKTTRLSSVNNPLRLRLKQKITNPYAAKMPPIAAKAPVPPAKGKKVKNQKLTCPEEAKAKGEDAVAWVEEAAIRGTAVTGTEVPGAAANHAERVR